MKITEWINDQMRRMNFTEEKKERFNTIVNIVSSQKHSGNSIGVILAHITPSIVNNDRFLEELNKLDEETRKELETVITCIKENADETKIESYKKLKSDLECDLMLNEDIYEVVNKLKELNFTDEELYQIRRLIDIKPLTLITGNDDEWETIKDSNKQQNIICPSIFRCNNDNNTAYYLDTVSYSKNGGIFHDFIGGGLDEDISRYDLHSASFIKFPFKVPDRTVKINLRELLNGDCVEADKEYAEYLHKLYSECYSKEVSPYTFNDVMNLIKENEEYESINEDLDKIKISRIKDDIKIENLTNKDSVVLSDKLRFVCVKEANDKCDKSFEDKSIEFKKYIFETYTVPKEKFE